jgi:hypothetical protein
MAYSSKRYNNLVNPPYVKLLMLTIVNKFMMGFLHKVSHSFYPSMAIFYNIILLDSLLWQQTRIINTVSLRMINKQYKNILTQRASKTWLS